MSLIHLVTVKFGFNPSFKRKKRLTLHEITPAGGLIFIYKLHVKLDCILLV